ncbi:helix-turn-helix domain-containing protein [Streptomyces cinereoruber]|uniref:helix-turn-helix domain-containing protein n=1 Tax=Streptomyces cinereoruber TaxID=67260 RepID=UPI003694C730
MTAIQAAATMGQDDDMAREVIPRDHLASGEWPTGKIAVGAPPVVHLCQAVAQALTDAMAKRGLGVRELARLAGLTHPTVIGVLKGTSLPGAQSVLLLEIALQEPLYPADLFRRLGG